MIINLWWTFSPSGQSFVSLVSLVSISPPIVTSPFLYFSSKQNVLNELSILIPTSSPNHSFFNPLQSGWCCSCEIHQGALLPDPVAPSFLLSKLRQNLSLLLLFPTSVVPPSQSPSLVSLFLQREKCWNAHGLGPRPHSAAVLPPVRPVTSSAAANAISMLMIPQICSAGLTLLRALDS